MPNGPYTVGQIPYGDAFIVNTPILDRIGREAHNEELQKQKQYRDNSQKLDDDFSKNVAGIRDADIDDLTAKYNDYKTSWKQLNKPGRTISPKEQLDLLRKKADVLKVVTSSKEEKANEDLAAKDVAKNPNNFNDDAHNVLIGRRAKPVSKFNDADKDIYGNILYKGNNTDFSKTLKEAEGPLQQRGIPVETPSTDGLTKTVRTYKGVNAPDEYFSNLYNGVKGSQQTKDYMLQNQFSDDESEKIIKQFTDYSNTPEFKAAYPNFKQFPPSIMASKLGQTMAVASMAHALQNPPTATDKQVSNVGEIMKAKNDATLNRQMTMEGIRQKDRESFYQYKKSGDEGGANMILNKVVDNMYDSGKINQNVKLGDTEYNGRIVSVPKEISKQYAQEYFDKDNMVKMKKEPDHFVLTNDKKFLIPLFMGAKNENGRSKLITNDNSAPIPIQDLKISLGRLILPKKQQGSEVIDDGSDPDAKSTPEKHTETTITKGSSSKSSKPKKITQNGYTYILNEKSGEYE